MRIAPVLTALVVMGLFWALFGVGYLTKTWQPLLFFCLIILFWLYLIAGKHNRTISELDRIRILPYPVV